MRLWLHQAFLNVLTQSLVNLHNAEKTGGLTYDVLLSDAFLDYLYYSKNVNQQAQRWLYATNAYKPELPNQEIIDEWQSAVKTIMFRAL